ncbi:TonB-dependent receptor [Joostella atrarenae]|uniref:TonB-dependent receptor n=1 Tax=Joostella atrarenae TaxID=679257 RepID=A0ABS9J504_9FLAO|nr:TonB-dependent receptor [Joostella atrarenae]MCF8715518.1 TonB-dependent receptor [Joostella atrarenae]
MKKHTPRKNGLILLLMLMINAVSFGRSNELFQSRETQKVVKGIVFDENHMPLPGATVMLKGSNNGVSTDFDGNFEILVPSSHSTLIFSYIGYKEKELIVDGNDDVVVQLEVEANALEAVMVVGYGKQKVRDLTGSVGFVNEKQLKENAVPSVSQALQGKVSGVQVTANSGEPGGGISVRIRGTGTFGNNDPLYVIDGFPTKTGISAINPSDIESISILKDAAAAAIYGSRAANGVIIVSTKKGKAGRTSISLESYFGFQETANQIDVLNAQEYVAITKEAYRNSGLDDNEFWQDPSQYGNGGEYPVDTDWQNEVFRTSPIENHQLTFSGGSDKSNFLMSLGYYNQEGIVIGSNFERISARANGTVRFSDAIRAGANLSFSESDRQIIPDDNSWTSVLFGALRQLPTVPVKTEDGNWGGNVGPAEYVGDSDNPVRLALLSNDSNKGYRFMGNSYIEIEPVKDLVFKTFFGYDFLYDRGKNFNPTYTEGSTQSIQSELFETSALTRKWVWENTVNYNLEILNAHKFDFLLGITKENNTYETLNGSRKDFPNNESYLWYLDAGSGTRNNSGIASEYALLSYLGRVNYSYKNKYLIQANIRRDGSSRFGKSNQFGTFPSVSVGWVASEEAFMKNSSFINYLKLRLSSGKLGNQDIYSNYPWANNLDLVYYPLGINQGTASGYTPNSPSNPDVTWETTIQNDIGIDMKFFNSQLSINADYFIKDTEDMLLTLPAPATSGYSTTAYTNVGKMRNQGFEISLDYESKQENEFTYGFGANFTTIKNEVLDLGTVDYIWSDQTYLGERWTRTEVGKPVSQFFGYVTDGIFQNENEVTDYGAQPNAEPGDIKFKDLDNNGVIDDNDRTYIGDPNPDFTFSVYGQANYKDFDLGVRIYGSYGNDIYNGMIRQIESGAEPYNKWTNILDRWTGEGTSNSVPRVTREDVNQNTRSSTRMIEDGSFLRVKNLQLGYSLPEEVLNNINVERLRLYVSLDNPFTITSYRGFDPEMYQTKSSRTDIGVDRAKYPVAKSFIFGLNISL